MDNNSSPEDRLAEEFKALGKNLIGMLQSAWERPERKELQLEIENGLKELSDSIKRETQEFTNSPTGQQVKSDLDKLGEQLRSGETPAKVKQEIISALQTANLELEKILKSWSGDYPDSPPSDPTKEE